MEAPYPPDALAAGIAGTVQLVITVDAAGAVTAVEVVQAPSDALRRAAQAAAEQFRFRLAVKDGSPIASRIPYEYRFELAAPAIGAIEGTILLMPAGGQNGQDAAAATALSTHRERTFSASAEMQNLTNTKIYDYWGVQKPGRAMYFKATLEL